MLLFVFSFNDRHPNTCRQQRTASGVVREGNRYLDGLQLDPGVCIAFRVLYRERVGSPRQQPPRPTPDEFQDEEWRWRGGETAVFSLM